MVEKIDEKTMCLETVKAIDLRQRKMLYRFWLSIAIIISFGFSGFLFYGGYIFLNEVETMAGNNFTSNLSALPSIVMIAYPIISFIFSVIIIVFVNKYLEEIYFPKEESDQK